MSAESKLQLAEAYMQIVPSMKGAQGVIAQSLGGAGVEGEKAGRAAGSRFSSALGSGLSSVGKIAAGVLGGNLLMSGLTKGLGAAKAAVFGFNSTLQNSSIAFTTMLGSGQKAQSFVGQLQKFAANTPFDFQGLVQNSQTMIGMGVSAKAVLPTLSALGDSVASVGGNSTTLNNTISAFSQTMAKGTLDMGNMNQMLQGGVPTALKVLAAQYHVTTGQMVKMISAGKVQSSEALPLLVKGLEQGTSATAALGGMMDKQSQTFSGAASNIGDSATQLTAKAFKPLFDISSVGMQAMAARLGSPAMSHAADHIAAGLMFVTSHLQDLQARAANFDFGALLRQAAPVLKAVVDIARSLSPLSLAFHVVAPLLPVIAQALGGLAASLAGSLQKALLAILPALATLAGTLAGTLSKALTGLAPVLTIVVGMLSGQLGAALTVLLPVLANVAIVLLNMVNGLLAFLQPLLSSPGVILAVVGALVAWKTVQGGISFVGLVGGLVKSTVQLGLNTVGWVRNTAAMVISKGETVILLGMYAGEFVGNVARATGALALQALGWAKTTAAMLISKAQTVILLGMYAGEFVGNMAKATASLVVQVAQWGLHAVAAGASAIATGAMAVASGVATAAQWALNTAMEANPIGLVVVAIVALVAGLVWFFSQTKLGQALWSGFVTFLGDAWRTLVSVAQTVWAAIVGAVQRYGLLLLAVVAPVIGIPLLIATHWSQIVAVASAVWAAVSNAVGVAVRWVQTTVATVLGLIVAGWRLEWAVLTSVVHTVWSAITTAVSAAIGFVHSVIATVVGLIVAGWRVEWAVLSAVIGAVWGAIKGAVSGAIGFVHDVIANTVGAIHGAWSAAWSAISGVLTAAWARIKDGVAAGIGFVVSLAGGIGGKILGAIGDAGKLLLSVGQHVVDGLVNGIRGAWDTVTRVVHDLAMKLPEPVRQALGIKSPSRVFMAIGQYIGQGLVKGLQGTADQVKTAMTDLTNKVTAAFDSLAKQRTAAQAKLKKLDQQYADTSTATAAGRRRRAELGAEISDQQKLVAQLGRMPSKATESAVTRMLRADNVKLTGLAKQRDTLTAQLKAAQATLTQALADKANYADGVAGGVAGLGNVTSVQGTANPDGGTNAVTGSDILSNLQSQVQAAASFNTELAQLKSMGLNQTTYAQLVQAFQSSGSTATADALMAGGQTQVAQLNSLQGQLQAQATALGNSAAATLYDAGVQADQGAVNGLKAKVADVTGAMGLVEAAAANAAKKLGVNVTPLLHQAGRDLGQGLADGIKSKASVLNKALTSLGKKAVTALKKELGIKSPSRVMHDEVGVQMGAGLANGVESTYGRVGRSVAGLVTVPKVPALSLPGVPGGAAGGVVQNFNGPMGYTADELAAKAAARARRALNSVAIPKVVVR